MRIDNFQISAANERWQARETARSRNMRLMQTGRLLEIDTPERVQKFLLRRGYTRAAAGAMLRTGAGRPAEAAEMAGERDPGVLERILGTNDLMGVAFFERGLQAARTIGRIWIGVSGGSARGYGTGFLVSPNLMMTNHHVLGDRALARKSIIEFDYQIGLSGQIIASTSFAIDADGFHVADRHLDYALVAVRSNSASGRALRDYGWNSMIQEEGKAIIGQWINIIQHPNAEPKQLAMRENRLVDMPDDFLHYVTDTAPGSSGAALYNDRWEVIGLHHSGVPAKDAVGRTLAIDGRVWRPEMGDDRIKWRFNEGIRISRILAHLRQQTLGAAQRRLLDEMFAASSADGEAVPVPDRSTPATPPNAAVQVNRDGTATWTIPLSVSVRLGGMSPADAAAIAPQLPIEPAKPAVAPVAAITPASGADSIESAAKREIGGRPDVMDVRLGYLFKNGWITRERAVVVTVRQKRSAKDLKEAGIPPLPDRFQGLPVDVTNPTIEQLVRDKDPKAAEAAFGGAAIGEEITYSPPTGAKLNPVNDTMRVIAHVSPDAGWQQLKAFLGQTQKRLVIAMYDFGAPHIADAIAALGKKTGFAKLALVMQAGESVGSGTKKDDFKDDEVVEKLRKAHGKKFDNSWVRIGRVNGWVSSSYHIKVAVRDQKAFWLSSGNWQSSNQPAADPLKKPWQRKWLNQYNRDWHAVVEHPALAKTYEKFILNDLAANADFEPEALPLPDLLLPEAFFVPMAEAAPKFRYFAPFNQQRKFAVQPLLTPDNYADHVLELINGAQDELIIQNQTFNAPGPNHAALREIMDAILKKQNEGVNLRIVFRVLFAAKARETLEALQDFGFDADRIKLQKGCHTKAIIVDRKRVLLGSQNLSNDGVSVNRDASLLFDDAPLAKYFADIFEHDWLNVAEQDIGSEALEIETASAADETPEGKIRLTWKDYMEML
jgi:V8-like Glu-specific endopeptidase